MHENLSNEVEHPPILSAGSKEEEHANQPKKWQIILAKLQPMLQSGWAASIFFLSISMPPIKASYLLRILKLSHISTARGPFPKDFSIVSDQFDFRVAHWRSCGLPRTPDLPKPMVIIQLKAEHCKLCVCHFVKCDHRQIYISIFLLSFTCLSIKGSHQQQKKVNLGQLIQTYEPTHPLNFTVLWNVIIDKYVFPYFYFHLHAFLLIHVIVFGRITQRTNCPKPFIWRMNFFILDSIDKTPSDRAALYPFCKSPCLPH